MSDFLEVPRRDKWRKRCQRKFRRRRYRIWTCYRPPLRKTNGGASRRRVREKEKTKTTSIFCCAKKMREREMRETKQAYLQRERERESRMGPRESGEKERSEYGRQADSLSLSFAAAYSVSFIFLLRQLLFILCFPPQLREILSLLFVFLFFCFFWEELLFVYFCFLISFYPIIVVDQLHLQLAIIVQFNSKVTFFFFIYLFIF